MHVMSDDKNSFEHTLERFMPAHERGWSVIPLKPQDKKAAIRWKSYQEKRADRNTILSWLGQWPTANVGIVTGEISGLVVLDVDGLDGMVSLAGLGIVPRTPKVITGKGWQFYFRWPGHQVRNFAGELPGLDLRGDGGYVVGAGSIHPNGKTYRWEISPEDAPLAEMPGWLIDLTREKEEPRERHSVPSLEVPGPEVPVQASARERANRSWALAALRYEIEKVMAAPDGTKHDRVRDSAVALGGLVPAISETEIEQELYAAVEPRAEDKREARKTIQDGIRYGMAHPREIPAPSEPAYVLGVQNAAMPLPKKASDEASPAIHVIRGQGEEQPARAFNLTDMGNAERLVDRYGATIRYCAGWKQWLIWDGARWAFDETGKIGDLAKQTVRQMYLEAAQCDDEGRRKALAKHAHQSESNGRVMGMLGRAQDEQSISITAGQLDRDPWLFNCASGTIDLRTGELREHNQEDNITKLSLVGYDAGAECPVWESFLDKIMHGNERLIGFLQRAAGYSLTGSTQERALFLLFGSGANGKSTFLETLRSVLGDYAIRTPTETLMQKRDQSVRDDVARLKGARFVSASETDEGKKLAESLIKDITGGDVMTARHLYSKLFEFKPECKIWLSTNHKPVITGTDKGIWDRIKLVPFEVRIPDDEQDKSLGMKLQTELEGILAWMVRGCLQWQHSGLGTPPEVENATEEYRVEMNVLGSFLEDKCVRKPGTKVTAKELYEAYTAWAKASGEDMISKKAVGMRLQEQGFHSQKNSQGLNVWLGLEIVQEPIEVSPV